MKSEDNARRLVVDLGFLRLALLSLRRACACVFVFVCVYGSPSMSHGRLSKQVATHIITCMDEGVPCFPFYYC